MEWIEHFPLIGALGRGGRLRAANKADSVDREAAV